MLWDISDALEFEAEGRARRLPHRSWSEGGDAVITDTLPNPPAEVVDVHSRKLSREIDDDRSSFSLTARLCMRSTAWRHTWETMKGSLSFGAMRNVHAVNCSVFGARAL